MYATIFLCSMLIVVASARMCHRIQAARANQTLYCISGTVNDMARLVAIASLITHLLHAWYWSKPILSLL